VIREIALRREESTSRVVTEIERALDT